MPKALGEDYDFIDIVKESDDIYPATKQILQKGIAIFLKILKEKIGMC